MTDIDDREGPLGNSRLARTRRRMPMVVHAGLLLLVLVGAAALTRAGTGVTSDEGAGAYQAVLLGRGRWILPPTLPELDPLRARQPFFRSEMGARGWAPYGKHPLYPVVLSLARRVRPIGGLVAVSVLGAWLAAVVAGLLAERIRRGRGPVALWLVGALSPLTIDGTWVLAHTPAAAAGAATAFAADRALRDRGSAFGRLLLALAGCALAAGLTLALRTEGVILVVALGVAVLGFRRPDRRSALVAAAVLAGGGAARLLEVVAARHIVGSSVIVPATPSPRAGFLADRLEAFRASWVDPGSLGGGFLLAAGALLAVAAVAHRRRFSAAAVAACSTLAVAGALVWLVRGADLVPGLLPATAWLGAGGVMVGRRSLATGLPRLLTISTLLSALGILAIQYSFGGGVEWGGRFYAILLPGAGALVAGAWPAQRRTEAMPLAAGLVLVAAVLSAGGLRFVATAHQRGDRLERDLSAAARQAAPGRPADPDPRPVVVSYHPLWPQLLWTSFDRWRWVTADEQHASCALVDLRRAGFQRIVVTDRPLETIIREAADAGWREVAAAPRSRFATVLVATGDPPPGAGCPTG